MGETREEDMQTYGGGAGEDIYQWTTNQFLSPTLLPDFKLQPIVKLFRPEFMNSKRVTRADGTAINHKRILTWLTSASPCLITSWSQGPQTVSGALVGWITAGELVNLIISTFINSGRKRSFEHNPRLVIRHNFLH